MKPTYFVIDEDNATSWPATDNADAGERFTTIGAATKRAEELAASEPGKTFLVCRAIRSVIAAVSDPEVSDIA